LHFAAPCEELDSAERFAHQAGNLTTQATEKTYGALICLYLIVAAAQLLMQPGGDCGFP
jgi:hypothetical protein